MKKGDVLMRDLFLLFAALLLGFSAIDSEAAARMEIHQYGGADGKD